MLLKIIFEDYDMLVVDKPPGLLTHQSKHEKENNLVSILKKKGYKLAENEKKNTFRDGIIHHLDKNTTGLIVVAKTAFFLRIMKKNFQKRKINKYYLTIVDNSFPKEKTTINVPLRVKNST